MKVVLIGTGNTATVLGRLIAASGHRIIQVYGRNSSNASGLAESLAATFTTSLNEIDDTGDIYLFAISDRAIAELSSQWQLRYKLVVHTAGSVSKEALKAASKNYGVLYPLQSLRKETAVMPVIPFLIDGNTNDNLTLLHDFAATLSPIVKKADDEERKRYHLAAILLNNFTNHLYSLTKQFCFQSKTDFNLLVPLIQQLPILLSQYSPEQLQTGPAIRNEQTTIDSHLHLLENFPEIKSLYALFTKSIQDYYKII